MRTWIVTGLMMILLAGSAGRAQTPTELLQRGIYTQETLGDLDAAIRIYQQVIEATQSASEVRAQAERRLQAARASQRQAASRLERDYASKLLATDPRTQPSRESLGTFDGRTYRHTWTGITFDAPQGWKVSDTFESSDQGEMVSLSAPDPRISMNVWMIKEKNDAASVEARLANAPIDKKQMRLDFEGWHVRAGSLQRANIGGHRAVVAIADYTSGNGRHAMAEYMTWIYTENARAFFFTRLAADELDQLRPQFDGIVYSAIIP